MRKTSIVLASGILVSSTAFAAFPSAEEMNATRGRAIVIADISKPAPPGTIDIAKKAQSQRDSGAGGDVAGAAIAGGASVGSAVAGGLLINVLANSQSTYDSRKRVYRVISEKDCKPAPGLTWGAEADLSGLTPGQFGHWMKSPSGLTVPLLTTLKGPDGKPVPKIDASHPCFAAYEAAVKEVAEKQASAK